MVLYMSTGQYGRVTDNLLGAIFMIAGRRIHESSTTVSEPFWAILGGNSKFERHADTMIVIQIISCGEK